MSPMALKSVSSYEMGILSAMPKTKADALTATKRVKAIINDMLGVETVRTLEDGTSVNCTVAEAIVAATLADMMQKPSVSKLKDLASIMGIGEVNNEDGRSMIDRSFADGALN